MNRILKAIEFARRAHEGQKRKYTGEDYIWHPIQVANIVSTVDHTEDMLIAAILHDTVEDTQTTLDDVMQHFGETVTVLVECLTDVSKPEDGNRGVHKNIDLLHTAKAIPEAKTIKLADLISNSKSILEHDQGFARIYMKEKQRLLEVLSEGDPMLWLQANGIVEDHLNSLEKTYGSN